MYDVIRNKNVTVDFFSTNDAPRRPQNVSDRGWMLKISKLGVLLFVMMFGKQFLMHFWWRHSYETVFEL